MNDKANVGVMSYNCSEPDCIDCSRSLRYGAPTNDKITLVTVKLSESSSESSYYLNKTFVEPVILDKLEERSKQETEREVSRAIQHLETQKSPKNLKRPSMGSITESLFDRTSTSITSVPMVPLYRPASAGIGIAVVFCVIGVIWKFFKSKEKN